MFITECDVWITRGEVLWVVFYSLPLVLDTSFLFLIIGGIQTFCAGAWDLDPALEARIGAREIKGTRIKIKGTETRGIELETCGTEIETETRETDIGKETGGAEIWVAAWTGGCRSRSTSPVSGRRREAIKERGGRHRDRNEKSRKSRSYSSRCALIERKLWRPDAFFSS